MLQGVRRLHPRPARVTASAGLQLPDEGRFQSDGLRPWFGGVGALGLGWRSVQGLSAGAWRVGRPLLRRRGARQVPGGPFWRGGGSWGAVGGELWSPLPRKSGFLGTDGLSARPWVRGRGGTQDCERPLVRDGGVLLLPVRSLISDPSLCGGPPLPPRAQSPSEGHSPLPVLAVADLGPWVCACHAWRPLTCRLGGASGQAFPAVPWSVWSVWSAPGVSAVFWTAPEAHVLAVSPGGWGPPGHCPVCLGRWGLKDCVVRSSRLAAWVSGDIRRD